MEKMDDFFTARVEEYDEHMLCNVEGCKEAYGKMAELIPLNTTKLLDLGCGTGLELNEIFKRHPNIEVTGIDLTQAMLDKSKGKYPDKNITLICASYFYVEFGKEVFDTAISFQTMHHFPQEEKQKLYSRIKESLKPGGQYIECDYMVVNQWEEVFYCEENQRFRAEQGVAEGELYHFDTPCTIDNQIRLFFGAGFKNARQIWRKGNTAMMIANKS